MPVDIEDSSDEIQRLSLFRKEVFSSSRSQWLGEIRLAQPISAWVVTLFSLLISLFLIIFILYGSVTKKTKVAGITVPVNGVVSVIAPNSGVLLHSYFKEGDQVKAGQNLFELSTERYGNQGKITALISQQLLIRKQTIDSERRFRNLQEIEKKRTLDERIINSNVEKNQLEQQMELVNSRLALANKTLEKFEMLQKSGFVSSSQAQQKQEELMEIEMRLSNLSRSTVKLKTNQISLLSERNSLSNNLAIDMEQFNRSEASLKQEIAENLNRQKSMIVASEAGTLTTATYQAGQSVSTGQVLATLIPNSGKSGNALLEAHLYVPSRSAGFLDNGQAVLIRYQSYPYQKFGLHEGIVIDVSRTSFAPNDLPLNSASTILSNAQQNISGFNSNEALYRVKVKLKNQNIFAYGVRQELKPGMTLEADIIQDHRKIWEWVAEPLLAMTK